MNWLGVSLEALLAPRRNANPRHGYFIDHSTDLIAQTLIILGLGFSPYFTLFSALLALSILFLMNCYTYLKVMVAAPKTTDEGNGPLEFRVLIAGWAALAAALGPQVTQAKLFNHLCIDWVATRCRSAVSASSSGSSKTILQG